MISAVRCPTMPPNRSHCSRSRASRMAPTRSWAAGWIAAILAREGVTVTPEVKDHLWSALTSLASAPVEERTLTGLSVLLQSQDLKRALATLLRRRSVRALA